MMTKRMATKTFVVAILLWTSVGPCAKGERKSLDLDPLLGGKQVWAMGADEFAKKYIRRSTIGGF